MHAATQTKRTVKCPKAGKLLIRDVASGLGEAGAPLEVDGHSVNSMAAPTELPLAVLSSHKVTTIVDANPGIVGLAWGKHRQLTKLSQ